MERQKIVHNKILDYAYSQQHCVYKDSQIAIFKGHHIPTSEPALVKIVDIKSKKPQQLSQYINNLKTMKALQNDNICRLMDIVNTPANIYVMFEYHEINLQQILADGKLSEDESIQLLEQIVSGLHYLSSKNIVHKNINCANVMIKQSKNGVLKVKIIHPSQNQELSSKHKDWFNSPQSLFKKVIGSKGDIWSLGVIYFQLIQGDKDIKSMDLEQFHKYTNSINTYKQMTVSNWSKNILTRMLVIQPEKRADINEITQMLKTRGQSSVLNYQPIQKQQQQLFETKLQLPLQQSKPLTAAIPTSPRQKQPPSLNQYHRSPLKYMNKSPMRRNHSFQANSKSPISHPNRQNQLQVEQKMKLNFNLQLAIMVERLLYIFNQSKVIYQQAVRISLLTLKHFSSIIKQIQKSKQKSKIRLAEDQSKLIKTLEQKVSHYEQLNTKKMEHDQYFTSLLSESKQCDIQFLNYIQFWLRLAIRHSIDFIEVNKHNMIQKRYLESIYWSYLHAIKYYLLLDWLKTDRKINKVPQFSIDKLLNQRQQINIESFKMMQQMSLKILRI